MGNFNAGAIEANLALGRSDWTRDLRKTEKEIADLERKSITIGVDLDTDNAQVAMNNLELFLEDLDGNEYKPSVDLIVNDAMEALEELEARLDALDARRTVVGVDADTDNAVIALDNLERNMDTLEMDPVNIGVDVDSAAAEAKLIELAEFQQMMTLAGVDIDVDVPGYASALAKMATLEAQAAVLDGTDINIDVDVDKAALASLVGDSAGGAGGGGGYLGLLKILLYAIIALAPILAVSVGAMTFAVVAFTAAVVGAMGPLLVLGGGLAGLVARYKEAKEAGEELSGPMADFADAIDAVQGAWDTFLDGAEDAGFDIMAQALNLVADVLPRLVPLFNATAEMIGGVLDSVGEFVNSSEFDEMLDFFGGFGIDMLETFLRIGGNLIRFFGRLFDAIAPFADQMMGSLEDTTAGWAEWADDLENNDAFQQWVDNAMKYGPMILDLLWSIIEAFMNIGEAIEPFAGPMLEGLTAFFDVIADMDPTILGAIIAGLAGMYLGLNVLVPIISSLMGLLGGLGSVLAIAFSPIGLIVLAIAGLVAMVIYLWKTNEDFRDGILDTWANIRDTIMPIINDIVGAIRDNWGPITEWAKDVFNDLAEIVILAFDIIEIYINRALAVIRFLWENFGDDLLTIGRGAFQIIGGMIRGAFQVIKGIFQVFKGLLTGDWRLVWEGIKNILRGAVTAVTGMVRGMINVVRGIISAGGKIIGAAWNAVWGAAQRAFSSFTGWVRNQWNDLIGWFRGLGGRISGAVSNIWDGIATSFKNTMNDVIGWWNNLSFSADIPDKIPGLPDSFSISTPNVGYLAKGGYITEPMLGVIGEGPDNEIVAPEPVLERIIRENSGGGIDYGRIGAAVSIALAPLLRQFGVSREDLERLIEAASINLNIDVESEDGATVARKIANAVGFNLRTLGYGGKYA